MVSKPESSHSVRVHARETMRSGFRDDGDASDPQIAPESGEGRRGDMRTTRGCVQWMQSTHASERVGVDHPA